MMDLPSDLANMVQRLKKQYVDNAVNPDETGEGKEDSNKKVGEKEAEKDEDYHSIIQVQGIPASVPLNKVEEELKCIYPQGIEFVHRNEADNDPEPIVTIGITNRKTRESMLKYHHKLLGGAITVTSKPTSGSMKKFKKKVKAAEKTKPKKKKESKKSSAASTASSRSRNRSSSNPKDLYSSVQSRYGAPRPGFSGVRPPPGARRKLGANSGSKSTSIPRYPRNPPGMGAQDRYNMPSNRPGMPRQPQPNYVNRNRCTTPGQGWNNPYGVPNNYNNNNMKEKHPGSANSNTKRPRKNELTMPLSGKFVQDPTNIYRIATFGRKQKSKMTQYVQQNQYMRDADKVCNGVIEGNHKPSSFYTNKNNPYSNTQQKSHPQTPQRNQRNTSPEFNKTINLYGQERVSTAFSSGAESDDMPLRISDISIGPINSQADIHYDSDDAVSLNTALQDLRYLDETYCLQPPTKSLRPREMTLQNQRKLLKSIRSLLLCAQRSQLYP